MIRWTASTERLDSGLSRHPPHGDVHRQYNPGRSVLLMRLSLILSLGLASLLVAGSLSAQTAPVVALNGGIYDGNGGPFVAGTVYHIVSNGGGCCGSVPAGQTLTIQPGAIVKIDASLTVRGTLIANNATFTSWLDDSAGGDSNGDGGMTVPMPGDWSYVEFGGAEDTSVIEDCIFSYAGNGTDGRAVWFRDSDTRIERCVIRDNAGDGVLFTSANRSVVKDCSFEDNWGIPIRGVAVGSVPGLIDNTSVGNLGGEFVFLLGYSNDSWGGSIQFTAANSMNGNQVFAVRSRNGAGSGVFRVASGDQLTLSPGTILKFTDRSVVSLLGPLNIPASATEPVVLTSFLDDSVGGDTNGDGNATSPQPGDWIGITFNTNSASVWDFVDLRYAGVPGSSAALEFNGAVSTLRHCVISRSASSGANVTSPAGSCQFVDSLFRDNVEFGIRSLRWQDLGASRNIQQINNAAGDRVLIQGGVISTPIELERSQIPGPLLMNGRTRVASNGILSLPPGTILKIQNTTTTALQSNGNSSGVIRLRGTGLEPIIITSARDDSVGGDTNGDGGATVPAPGDFGQIRIDSNAASTLENVVIRYGGISGQYALYVDGSQQEVRSVRVEHAGGHALQLNNPTEDLENLVAFDCAGDGVFLSGGSADVVFASIVQNTGTGLIDNNWNGSIESSILRLNGGATANVVAAQVSRSNGAFPGMNGNVDVPSGFVDLANGDLHLSTTSPLLGLASNAAALTTVVDFDGQPRIGDGLRSGVYAADIGAYELSPWRILAIADLQPGGSVALAAFGAPGLWAPILGFDDGSIFINGIGLVTAGANFFPATPGFTPIGAPAVFSIPNLPSLSGLRFALQAVTVDQNARIALSQRFVGTVE